MEIRLTCKETEELQKAIASENPQQEKDIKDLFNDSADWLYSGTSNSSDSRRG